MKRRLLERPALVAVVAVAVLTAVFFASFNYRKLPFIGGTNTYSAYFAESGGITTGSKVRLSGVNVGEVSEVRLDGPRVRIDFTVRKSVHLGDRTEAAIRIETVLGSKMVELTSRGERSLVGTIPLDRTISPYDLPSALGDLTTTISGLDTRQLSGALTTLAQTFQDTPPDLRLALDGVARFSDTLNARDNQLRNLLGNANKVSAVLAQRSDQIVQLVANSNALLNELLQHRAAIDNLLTNLTDLSHQISGVVTENRTQLRPALDKLNGVLEILDNRKKELQKAIPKLKRYIMNLGETVAAGPFFKAYIANLVPGQFIQPFVDAAFSDLGVDPNVLAPSQLTDPEVGQRATPALPVPFPRTGQGGDPRLTLPDAITGKPGDPRYPYREPPPAPPPGGPPPGPPAERPPQVPPQPVQSDAAPDPSEVVSTNPVPAEPGR
jgi:phospholipid/cholesterol/gamma-HCH transport system substrate-binding protein